MIFYTNMRSHLFDIPSPNPGEVVNFENSFDSNCTKSVDDIIELIDRSGFVSQYPIDLSKFKQDIFLILKSNIEGNVNYAR